MNNKGIFKNPSRKFWSGLISFVVLGCALFFSIERGAPDEVIKCLMFLIGWVSTSWMLGIAAVDSLIRGLREYRMMKLGVKPSEENDEHTTIDIIDSDISSSRSSEDLGE